jgi:hypothetical protein
MPEEIKVRWGWLRFMYIYTIVGAGGFGLGMIFVPEVIKTAFRWPVEEPIAFGIVGSVYVAFGILSILGLRSPLRFVPVLLLQLCYKSIWLIGVILPMLITGRFPPHAVLMVIIFATYIIGDLIAIPFSCILARQPGSWNQTVHRGGGNQ